MNRIYIKLDDKISGDFIWAGKDHDTLLIQQKIMGTTQQIYTNIEELKQIIYNAGNDIEV